MKTTNTTSNVAKLIGPERGKPTRPKLGKTNKPKKKVNTNRNILPVVVTAGNSNRDTNTRVK
jgi:hypothetical protein